jgi:hypothetical protein
MSDSKAFRQSTHLIEARMCEGTAAARPRFAGRATTHVCFASSLHQRAASTHIHIHTHTLTRIHMSGSIHSYIRASIHALITYESLFPHTHTPIHAYAFIHMKQPYLAGHRLLQWQRVFLLLPRIDVHFFRTTSCRMHTPNSPITRMRRFTSSNSRPFGP